MKFKSGVEIGGVSPELALGLMVADGIYRDEFHTEMVITSVTDSLGTHGPTSRHRIGMAADLRTNPALPGGVPEDRIDDLVRRLSEELRQFLVLREPSHLHLQFNG